MTEPATRSHDVTLFVCGDVMTGRGIDQILPDPSAPELQESCVRDAREYVALAEQVNGPLARPVDFRYIWGDALAELDRVSPHARIINLETSITTGDMGSADQKARRRGDRVDSLGQQLGLRRAAVSRSIRSPPAGRRG